MIILISNDDGIDSQGLTCLESALQDTAEIWTVAPDGPQSASGRALTLHKPIRIDELSTRRYMVGGTPTDCVNIAINHLLPVKPDLVVSGINRGANLCDDITYSGTVAAAFEASILKIPAIAVSLSGKDNYIFGPAAEFAVRVAEFVLRNNLPPGVFLNINIPDTRGEKISAYKITHQGKSMYSGIITKRVDPRGRNYYWIGGDGSGHKKIAGSDSDAISNKCASITPVKTDLTDYSTIDTLKSWEL